MPAKIERDSRISQSQHAAAFLINLDRNKERLLWFVMEYSKSDLARALPVRRFAAIVAKEIDIARCVTPKALDQMHRTLLTNYCLRHYEMTPGAVGCFLSHISVLCMLLQDPAHSASSIVEDDAEVPRIVTGQIAEVLRKVPPDWDVLLFGYHYATFDSTFEQSDFDRLITFWGTHALACSKRGVATIVADYERKNIDLRPKGDDCPARAV